MTGTRGRLEFTSPTKRDAYKRSNGVCECHLIPHVFKTPCRQRLTDGRVRYEHIICDAMDPDNSLGNCAVLTTACWRYKTDNYDLPVIAKMKRQGDRRQCIKSRKGRALPGGRDSNVKFKMNGQRVDRRTGERI